MNAIQQARRDAQLDVPQLALAVGVAPCTVLRWEDGSRLPRPAAAVRLCAVLPALTIERIYATANPFAKAA
jgi:DNA-binding XRE family transcriptional regulator